VQISYTKVMSYDTMSGTWQLVNLQRVTEISGLPATETLVNTYPSAWCYIPENLNLCSLQYSQKPDTGSNPQPVEYSLYCHTIFIEDF